MPGNDLFKRSLILIFLCFLPWVWPLAAIGDTGWQIEGPVRQSITTLKQTQQQEERWRQEQEKLVARFEQLQQRQSEMQSRVAQLRQQIEATRVRVAAEERQPALTALRQMGPAIIKLGWKGVSYDIRKRTDFRSIKHGKNVSEKPAHVRPSPGR